MKIVRKILLAGGFVVLCLSLNSCIAVDAAGDVVSTTGHAITTVGDVI